MVHTSLAEGGYCYGTVTMPSVQQNRSGNTSFELTHMWVKVQGVHINKEEQIQGLAMVSFVPVDYTLRDLKKITWSQQKIFWMPFQPLFTSADAEKGEDRSSLMVNGLISFDLDNAGHCNNYTCRKEKCMALREQALLYKRGTKKRINDAENKGTLTYI